MRRLKRHHLPCTSNKPAALQPLRIQRRADAVPRPRNTRRDRRRVDHVKAPLGLGAPALHPAPHAGMAGRKPCPHAGRQCDHRATSALMTAPANSSGAVPNSISTAGASAPTSGAMTAAPTRKSRRNASRLPAPAINPLLAAPPAPFQTRHHFNAAHRTVLCTDANDVACIRAGPSPINSVGKAGR